MVRRPATALAAAFACLGGLVVTGVLTFGSGRVRWLDAAALQGFVGLDRPATRGPAEVVAALGDPLPYVLAGAALVALALARGRPRIALAVPVVLAGSALTTADPQAAARRPARLSLRRRRPGGRGLMAERARRGGDGARAVRGARVAAALAPAMAVFGAGVAVAVSYAHADPRLALPERRPRRLPRAGVWMTGAVAALWAAGERWPARSGREAAARWGAALAPAGIGALVPPASGWPRSRPGPPRWRRPLRRRPHGIRLRRGCSRPRRRPLAAGAFAAALRR